MATADQGSPVGCIGLGRMGGAIATRLLGAGRPLVVHDLDEGACARLAALGARVAASPREVADMAETVFACLPGPAVSREVAFGEAGVIGGSAIRHHVEMSTLGPVAMREVAGRLADRGIATLDAPVSGGPRAAETGALTLILSGEDDLLASVRPLLDTIGRTQTRVGSEPGMAQLAKLANNALSLAGMALASEAMVVGVAAGLDADALLAVINAGTGRNAATMDKFPQAVLTRRFDYGGPLDAAVKDLSLFLAEAERCGVPVGVTAAGERMWREAAAEGDPARDFTTIVQLVERRAGVELVGREAQQEKERPSVQ